MGRILAIASLVCWTLLGCFAAYRVHQQRAPEFDFAQAETYDWLVVESSDAARESPVASSRPSIRASSARALPGLARPRASS
jgi:hypothetical protein